MVDRTARRTRPAPVWWPALPSDRTGSFRRGARRCPQVPPNQAQPKISNILPGPHFVDGGLPTAARSTWHRRSMAPEDGGELTTAGTCRSFSAVRTCPIAVSAAAIGLASRRAEGSHAQPPRPRRASRRHRLIVLSCRPRCTASSRPVVRGWPMLVNSSAAGSPASGPPRPPPLCGSCYWGPSSAGTSLKSFCADHNSSRRSARWLGGLRVFHLGRAGLYLVWLVVGVWLVVAHRRTGSRQGRP